ncbi:hypothetical protein BC938DRAFT_478553 [Jimgerdemannia flammicorona]|uniref:Uncharacterized protein n=1 Tax=Jimgerdemannia flammicorona TaxID=994334 RepID=A0A433QYA0_9FUNG|nr:hypothetical protein BC938DRAFT_478553 [Jimgerdemannia flammicorona]
MRTLHNEIPLPDENPPPDEELPPDKNSPSGKNPPFAENPLPNENPHHGPLQSNDVDYVCAVTLNILLSLSTYITMASLRPQRSWNIAC